MQQPVPVVQARQFLALGVREWSLKMSNAAVSVEGDYLGGRCGRDGVLQVDIRGVGVAVVAMVRARKWLMPDTVYP